MPKAPRTAEVARRLVDAYVTSLRQHLPTYCVRQLDKLPGAQEHQLTRLRQSYPGTPTELLYFLQRVNGTCWESLVTPTGSAPPSTATTAAPATSAEGGAPTAAASPQSATTSSSSTTGAAAATATATDSASAAAESTKAAKAATAAAAAIASEAAAFIKSTLGKKGAGGNNGTRPRRLPHYVALPILGSTYTSCPYYLKSVEQMLLAEQQFPPPSANLPDEGEGWAPPASASPAPPLASTTTAENTPADAAKEGGLSEVAATAACAQLNKNSISSVFSGYKIVFGVPPSFEGQATTGSATAKTATTAGVASAEPGKAAAAASIDRSSSDRTTAGAKSEGEEKMVFVDPRIDVNANFYQWLVFADSVQPHVRGTAPVIPDADPAKMAAAAAANAASAAPPLVDTKAAPLAAGGVTLTPATATAAEKPKEFAASRLYIDFKPVELEGGVYGQVIQFVHGQPSSFTVVAYDFGSYLKYVMSEEFEFTEELEDDDDEEEEEVDLLSTKAPPNDEKKGTATSGASKP